MTPGTPAIVAARLGRGRVIAMSPHPEKTDGLRPWIPAAILHLAGAD